MKRTFLLLFASIMLGVSIYGQNTYFSKSSPYELNWKKDLIYSGVSAGMFFWGVNVEKNEPLPNFTMGSFTQNDINSINKFDRKVAGRWDVDAKDNGKIFKFTASRLVPISLLLLPGDLKSRGTLGLLFLQGHYLNVGLGSLAKGSTNRYRPFAYLTLDEISKLTGEAEEEFLEDVVDDDIEDSFYSGDAATTAYGLMFFAKTFNDYYPESKWKYGVWGASILGTGLGAYFRAKSGKHFPSDVLVGSIVGSGLGILIPHLHKKRGDRKLSLNSTSAGLSLTLKLR